jgi:hypothetical protein
MLLLPTSVPIYYTISLARKCARPSRTLNRGRSATRGRTLIHVRSMLLALPNTTDLPIDQQLPNGRPSVDASLARIAPGPFRTYIPP